MQPLDLILSRDMMKKFPEIENWNLLKMIVYTKMQLHAVDDILWAEFCAAIAVTWLELSSSRD